MIGTSGLDLSGEVAVITGGGRGIGAAIAQAFAGAGADIVVAALDLQSAEQTAQQVRGFGRKGVAIKADVGEAVQVDQLFNHVRAEFCRLDILAGR